jgi:hypothetical protein
VRKRRPLRNRGANEIGFHDALAVSAGVLVADFVRMVTSSSAIVG